MARPKLPADRKKGRSITVKLTEDMRARLEAMVEALAGEPEHQHANVGLSYVARLAMVKGLDLLEFEYRTKPKA